MGRYLKHAGVVVLALAGAVALSMPGYGDGTGQSAAPGNTGTTAQPADQSQSIVMDTTTAAAIRDRMASIVNTAVTKDGFDNMVGSLEKVQRDRIDAEHFKDVGSLNDAIASFRKDFKSKYNEDFSFRGDMLDEAGVYQGKDKDHARVEIGAAFTALGQDKAHNDLEHAVNAGKSAVGNLVYGIKDLNLMKEPKLLANGWRLELTGSPTAQQLSLSLQEQITKLDNNRDKWPTDSKTAYLETARHVFRAIQNANDEHAPTASLR